MSYYGAPGGYGQPPGYGGYPAQSSSPPGMAPGMNGPPGANMNQAQHPLPTRPGAFPPNNFQNMPAFDVNAPVIRMGPGGLNKSDTPSNPRSMNNESMGQRRGLGMDRNIEQQRQQIRDNMQSLLPPRTEEVLRTIFIGNITAGCGGDAGMENLLRCAGSLRKWTRAIDAQNKPCTFGFAEFEDSESLETAAEILKDIDVPVEKQQHKTQPITDKIIKQENGDKMETDGAGNSGVSFGQGASDEKVKTAKLLVVVDSASRDYAENWRKQRGDSEETIQFRLDSAREALQQVLHRLFHPGDRQDEDERDAVMYDMAQDPITGDFVSVPIHQAEDELADIPPEMRETVAAEIAAFRERSNQRDMERLRREEEMESRYNQQRDGRHESIPTGPSATNGIPSGPKGVYGAPSGPKVFRGIQVPDDYQNGVSFVNGSSELSKYLGRNEDDTEASDDEMERRRRAKKDAEKEKVFLDYERKWLNRERARGAALDREKRKDENEAKDTAAAKKAMARMLKDWNDDSEASKRQHGYYADRSAWAKHRATFRIREAAADSQDRRDEEAERRASQNAEDQARGMADAFLDQQAEELGARGISTAPRFKISLGAAAQKARQAAEVPKRKVVMDAENLLDVDEATRGDDDAKRTLVPIKFDTLAEAAALTDEERQEARRQLAYTIPQVRDGLFKWEIAWPSLTKDVIDEQLRPFVEKRSMEYLGVVEELMWDVVADVISKKEGPQRLVEELEGLLEDETEGFVKKLWRMVVFYSESERRGLNQVREGDAAEKA